MIISGVNAYDAVNSSKRRPAPVVRKHVEDRLLRGQERDKLASSGWQLVRNYSLIQWMIGVHLRYVASFQFQCETGIDTFDDYVEKLVDEFSQPEAFEASGRFSRQDFVRLAEGCSIIDGDIFGVKLSNYALQAIEGSMIVDPQDKKPGERWFNGVQVNKFLKPLRIAVAEYRDDGTTQAWGTRKIAARNVLHHRHYSRFAQIRGISPIASAVNSCLDTYDFSDLSLARMRIEQLMALKIKAGGDPVGDYDDYDVNFGDGPVVLNLNPGDDADFLTADSPGKNSQEMMAAVMALALKALDIPFSFFNESFTNFYGSRGAASHYEEACKPKQAKLMQFLDGWLRWRLAEAIVSGRLVLPAGVDSRLKFWEWVPNGMPWWDVSREVPGEIAAINGGFTCPQDVAKKHGGNYYRNIEKTRKAREFAEAQGVPVSFGIASETQTPSIDSAMLQDMANSIEEMRAANAN